MKDSSKLHLLGIDGGGTKTTIYLTDQDKNILAEAKTGPMSLAAVGETEAIKNLTEAVDQVFQTSDIKVLKSVVVGLAGVDTNQEKMHASDIFRPVIEQKAQIENFQLVNDTAIALASGTDSDNAICLIAGTGSNCVGHNSRDKTAKAGGMDYLLSDEGSGYAIGAQVLKAAVRSFDGRGKKTIMEQLVAEKFGIESLADLKNKVYHPALTKTEIAEVSRICFTALEQQDTMANEIFNQAIEEILLMIYTVVGKLELQNIPTDVVLVGGIATDPVVVNQLQMRINAQRPYLNIIVPDDRPVMGAIKLAITQI